MLFSVLTPPHQPPWALALLPIPGPACPPQPWAHRAALLLCHSRPCCLDLGMIQIQIQPPWAKPTGCVPGQECWGCSSALSWVTDSLLRDRVTSQTWSDSHGAAQSPCCVPEHSTATQPVQPPLQLSLAPAREHSAPVRPHTDPLA